MIRTKNNYLIRVSETLNRDIIVPANSVEEAIDTIVDAYDDGKIALDYNDTVTDKNYRRIELSPNSKFDGTIPEDQIHLYTKYED